MNKPYIHGMLPDAAEPAPAAKAEEPAIRFLGDMQRLQPKPGDVFVLTCEQRVDQATAERIRAMVSGTLNGAKVLVLDGGLKLGVVAAQPEVKVMQNVTINAAATIEQLSHAMRRAQRQGRGI